MKIKGHTLREKKGEKQDITQPELRRIVFLTEKLIAIKSVPDNTKALETILELVLSHVKEYTIERFEHNGVKSALVYNSARRPKKFKIILNGHLDIIPGKGHQYAPKIKGNKLYGVGSMDMKANVACLITVFKEIASVVNYPLALQLVTDEEIGGFHGTKHQIDQGVRAGFVIVGEGTNLDIENKTKGILWVNIITIGKTAHSAYPWKGDNAIWRMYSFLDALKKKYPNPKEARQWATTVNPGIMETNNKTFNKIPDQCELGLDIRYIPEESGTIIDTIKKLLPEKAKLKIRVKEPALSTDENNPYVQLLTSTIEKTTHKKAHIVSANGSSDARHFARVNCPAVEFGPIGGGMGSDNEWVNVSSLEKYCSILKTFLLAVQ